MSLTKFNRKDAWKTDTCTFTKARNHNLACSSHETSFRRHICLWRRLIVFFPISVPCCLPFGPLLCSCFLNCIGFEGLSVLFHWGGRWGDAFCNVSVFCPILRGRCCTKFIKTMVRKCTGWQKRWCGSRKKKYVGTERNMKNHVNVAKEVRYETH